MDEDDKVKDCYNADGSIKTGLAFLEALMKAFPDRVKSFNSIEEASKEFFEDGKTVKKDEAKGSHQSGQKDSHSQ